MEQTFNTGVPHVWNTLADFQYRSTTRMEHTCRLSIQEYHTYRTHWYMHANVHHRNVHMEVQGCKAHPHRRYKGVRLIHTGGTRV